MPYLQICHLQPSQGFQWLEAGSHWLPACSLPKAGRDFRKGRIHVENINRKYETQHEWFLDDENMSQWRETNHLYISDLEVARIDVPQWKSCTSRSTTLAFALCPANFATSQPLELKNHFSTLRLWQHRAQRSPFGTFIRLLAGEIFVKLQSCGVDLHIF